MAVTLIIVQYAAEPYYLGAVVYLILLPSVFILRFIDALFPVANVAIGIFAWVLVIAVQAFLVFLIVRASKSPRKRT